MRFVLLSIALFACLWALPAHAESALTKPNNDASLRPPHTRGMMRSGGRPGQVRHQPRHRPAIQQPKD
jgi:hypothetical protein